MSLVSTKKPLCHKQVIILVTMKMDRCHSGRNTMAKHKTARTTAIGMVDSTHIVMTIANYEILRIYRYCISCRQT